MSRPWYEDDALWEDLLPVLFPESRVGATAGEVTGVLTLAGLAPGPEPGGAAGPAPRDSLPRGSAPLERPAVPAGERPAVLDLACGIGRHCLELARRGFRVTGVDRTRLYLERAARRAREEGLEVELVREDMRRFRRPEAFAAAVNLFTSFGYFPDPADDRRVLENVLASLRPGGVFVLDLMGKEVLARIFQERDWHREEDFVVMEERRVRHAWSWIESRWTILRPGRKTEIDISHRLYSAAELRGLLESVGFGSVQSYGDLEGRPYDQDARRLVTVARR
jgi:SAM-dependent methyltransferase